MNSRHPVRPEPDASTGEAPVISSAPKVDLARASMVAAFFMTDKTKVPWSARAGIT
jgi:hypothetical protein